MSGITEKSEEESRYTDRLCQNSGYNKEREQINNTMPKHEAFMSSNSSARSSRINSRLLRYFEDSLQGEVPVSMSPSVKPSDKSNDMKTNSINNRMDISNPKCLTANGEIQDDNVTLSTPKSSSNGKDGRRRRCSHDNMSNYSMSKSNNYEDLHSNNTSSKKKYNHFYINKQAAESEDSSFIPKITFEQLMSKDDSENSSMTRKERDINNFIESAKEDNVLSNLGENDPNLNISAISRVDDSTPSQKQINSEENKTELEDSKIEKKISRQPTFSSLTPQPKIESDRDNYLKSQHSRDKENRAYYNKSERVYATRKRCFTPLLSSSRHHNKLDDLSQVNIHSGDHTKIEPYLKSSDGT